MKTLPFLSACLLVLTLGTFISCQTIPEYPVEPKLSFKTIEPFLSFENGTRKDSLVIVTRFEDGDGDLGLNEKDKEAPPFNTSEGRINYFIEVLIKKNNQFQTLNLPISYNGSFFRLSPDDRIGPIEGDLRYGSFYTYEAGNPYIKAGDIIKFRIKVKDRAQHISNTIETEEVVMFRRTPERP